MPPELIANVALSGVLTGLVYGLMALGLNVIFGVVRVVNFAHGELVAVLAELQRRDGFALLLIDHVLRAVRALAQRVAVLHHGELIASGSTEQVLRNPAVVSSYLGTSPLLDGEAG